MTHPDPPDRLEYFTRLWVQNQRAVAAFIHMSLRDAHHAEDVLQEVAADASRNFGRYDPARPFAAWLIGIARQRLVDHYRKQERQRAQLSQDVLDLLDQSYAEVAEEVDDRLVALRKCMEKLPEHHKLLVNRRYGFDDPLADIAKSIGSNAKAVNAMLTRVRKLLADCVQQRMEATHD
ncbi:MAG: sigma-70 family RNA polymerase sigma factor [Phycisphaeraceae bacterium]|nr:sigma-70 family RNA polymerase sigma factor [Phycisphaeraceae bacterium]